MMTVPAFRARKGSGPPLVVLTAYDAPTTEAAESRRKVESHCRNSARPSALWRTFRSSTSVGVHHTDMMGLASPIYADEKATSDFGQLEPPVEMNLACATNVAPVPALWALNSLRDFRLRPSREGAAPHQAL